MTTTMRLRNENQTGDWMLDGQLNLSLAAEQSGWHLGTMIDALQSRGVSRTDAEAFAHYVFEDASDYSDASDDSWLTPEQDARVSVYKRQ